MRDVNSRQFSIALAGVVLLGAMAPLARAAERDAAWVDKKVRATQPTPEERRFDQIGWLTDIRSAEKLAKEHNRPIFLFTHDGHMAIGRC